MPSIYDVARLAGVSKSTVSRVVNYAPDVAPALREAVLNAIKQLDYKPALNRRHRRLSASPTIRTGHILMLSSWQSRDVTGESSVVPLLSTLLKGAGAAAHELHLKVLTASHVPGEPLADVLDFEQVDGVLLVGRWDGLEAQLEQRIGVLPAVLMMRDYGLVPQNAVRVYYDNQAVGAIAARYLLDAGHKRVAFLNPERRHRAFGVREAAFVEVMKQARGNVLSLQGDVSTAGKEMTARSFVEKMKRARVFPSALCVASDSGLPELYAALEAVGIKPQADVVIVSCNNEEGVMRDLSPRPVTIDIRADLIGRLAVQQLHWRIHHPHLQGDITVMVTPELVVP